MRLLPLLLLSASLLTGCMAGAAGVAGANAEKDDDISYYLKVNEVAPRIKKAMRSRRLTKGMDRAQVRLVMGAKTSFEAFPSEVRKEEEEVWIYESTDPMTTGTYTVRFEDQEVVSYEEP